MMNRPRIGSIVLLATWIAGADVQAECGLEPGRVEVTFSAQAVAFITAGGGLVCNKEVLLNAPGTAGPAECKGNAESPVAATASVTMTQSSSRIEISGSCSTVADENFTFQFNAFILTNVSLRAVGGPVQMTVTIRRTQVTDGVVISDVTSPPSTFVRSEADSPASFSEIIMQAKTNPGGSASTVSGTFFTVDIVPLEEITPTTFNWSNAAGGSFNNASNWNPDCDFPQHTGERSDTAIFGLTGLGLSPPVPVLAGSIDVGRFIIREMDVDLNGAARALGGSIDVPSFEVASGGSLVLDTGSTFFSKSARVGGPGSPEESQVIVRGPGATTWTTGSLLVGFLEPGTVTVGAGGKLVAQQTIQLKGSEGLGSIAATQGTLRIEDGGQVETPELSMDSGPARIEVRGVGTGDTPSALRISNLLRFGGSLGSGSILIEDGGLVEAADISIGSTSSVGPQTVTVSGVNGTHRSTLQATGESFANEFSFDGPAGTQIEIKDGASLITRGVALIGKGGGTEKLLVNNTASNLPPFDLIDETGGAFWKANGAVVVDGATDPAEIVVADGGVVLTFQGMTLGSISGKKGLLTVSGDGSQAVILGETVVGGEGQGEMKILDGGFVRSNQASVGRGTTIIDPNIQNNAISLVRIQGSLFSPAQWRVVGDLFVGTGGATGVIFLSGGLTGAGATLSVEGLLTVGNGGTIGGEGTLAAPNQRVINHGFIAPGLSPGTITIEGDYEQPEDGVLEIEVAGLEPGQFDVLHITGNATLAGQVDLRFINGFVPTVGQEVDFVQVDGTITGVLTGKRTVEAGGGGGTGSGGTGDGGTDGGDGGDPGNDGGSGDGGNGTDGGDGGTDTGGGTDDEPAFDVDVIWEVTPDGTCRFTVIDVRPAPRPLPIFGLCGTGITSMFALTLLGLWFLKALRYPPAVRLSSCPISSQTR